MSNSESRTKNVARNAVISLLCQAVALLMQFVGRAVFVNVLGMDYLGVSGLYTNVLTDLSFAELGIGNAMIFSMYKPLAENDTEKLKSLMALYKKAYCRIGLFIAAAGLCLIPFMNLIIREKPAISENLTLIYLLYLLIEIIEVELILSDLLLKFLRIQKVDNNSRPEAVCCKSLLSGCKCSAGYSPDCFPAYYA